MLTYILIIALMLLIAFLINRSYHYYLFWEAINFEAIQNKAFKTRFHYWGSYFTSYAKSLRSFDNVKWILSGRIPGFIQAMSTTTDEQLAALDTTIDSIKVIKPEYTIICNKLIRDLKDMELTDSQIQDTIVSVVTNIRVLLPQSEYEALCVSLLESVNYFYERNPKYFKVSLAICSGAAIIRVLTGFEDIAKAIAAHGFEKDTRVLGNVAFNQLIKTEQPL